jgi:asparagine synthase (glutamine-hydrolysing)
MAGIVGVVGEPAVVGLADLLVAMASRLRTTVPGSARHAARADEASGVGLGRVALAFVNTGPQPATNEDESLLAVLEGEILDAADHRRRLEAAGHCFAGNSHAELLVHGLENEGPNFLRRLNGKFAAAVWDATARKLILVTDRFGMKPLYYARLPGRLLFASEIKALLADPDVSRRTSLRGLSQFFTFGQLLGEDTLFDGVRLLPAAGLLTYEADTGQVALDRYWRLQARPAARTNAETFHRIDTAFARAVDRCTGDAEGLGLSLSGGMDARTILALAASQGRKLTTLSLGMDGSMDHRSAAAMAQLVGCPHNQVVLGEEFLSQYESHLRHMVRLTDGQYLCQCIVMPTLPIYRDLGIRVLLRGHAGELMHMSKAYNFSLDRGVLAITDEAQQFAWLWRRLQAYMLDGTDGRLFASQFRDEVEGLARDSLRDAFAETAGTEPSAHRIWQMFIAQRLRRETALSLVEFDSVVETRLPYLDNDLVDDLFAAPPEMKLGDTIQAHILRRRRPDFLRVPNVNTGTVVGAGRVRRAVGNFRRRVLAKLGVKGYQPYERLGLWLRRQLRPLVEGLLLDQRCLERGMFDPDAVRTIVSDHIDHRKNHTYLLMAMLIYETGQREFVDADAATELPAPVAV